MNYTAPRVSGFQGHTSKNGWEVMAVMAATPKEVGWAYTIGLYDRFQHPELFVSGLPQNTARTALDTLGCMVAQGIELVDGMGVDRVLTAPCELRRIPPTRTFPHLGLCTSLYRTTGFPALQLVWPDLVGRFPWEEGWRPTPPQELLFTREEPQVQSVSIFDRFRPRILASLVARQRGNAA